MPEATSAATKVAAPKMRPRDEMCTVKLTNLASVSTLHPRR